MIRFQFFLALYCVVFRISHKCLSQSYMGWRLTHARVGSSSFTRHTHISNLLMPYLLIQAGYSISGLAQPNKLSRKYTFHETQCILLIVFIYSDTYSFECFSSKCMKFMCYGVTEDKQVHASEMKYCVCFLLLFLLSALNILRMYCGVNDRIDLFS